MGCLELLPVTIQNLSKIIFHINKNLNLPCPSVERDGGDTTGDGASVERDAEEGTGTVEGTGGPGDGVKSTSSTFRSLSDRVPSSVKGSSMVIDTGMT